MTTILKLGGSVITEKDVPETVATDALTTLAEVIATTADDLVLVHGGGSFGHHHASEHGVSRTTGTHDAAGVRDIHTAMKELNDAVIGALAEADVAAVPVHPFSAGRRTAEGDLLFNVEPVATMLDEGFVPVLHGDVIAHEGEGATIISGDELVVALATALKAERVGLCSAVPGVLDTDGQVVEHITAFSEVADALGGSDATDVTGGMARKVEELLALDAPAYVFDHDGVSEFLSGGSPGTRIG